MHDPFSGRLGDLLCTLESEGFTRKAGEIGALIFDGKLCAEDQCFPCELTIDSQMLQPPKIFFLKIPEGVGPALPHIFPCPGEKWDFCYLTESISFATHPDPVGRIRACIEVARETLGRILRHEMDDDLAPDFQMYWGDTKRIRTDIPPEYTGTTNIVSISGNKMNSACMTTDSSRTIENWTVPGLKAKLVQEEIGYVIALDACPHPPLAPSHAPESLLELSNWLEAFSPLAKEELTKLIDAHYFTQHKGHYILFTHDSSSFGIHIEIKPEFSGERRRRHSPKLSAIKDRWFSPIKVFTRIIPDRIDEKFLSTRGKGEAPLAGKTIALIGCGTVGGYTAHALVRAGAGTNGGTLHLIDPDSLGPCNLYRHLLGRRYLYENKAHALKKHLKEEFPEQQIQAHPSKIIADIEVPIGSDLVIDVTGNMAVSMRLNVERLAGRIPNIIHGWVVGAGIAGQVFFAESGEACLQCLYGQNGKYLYSPDPSEEPPLVREAGCTQYYTPYAATASMQSGAKVVELAIDWAKGNPSPKLRTVYFNREKSQHIEDMNPAIKEECPHCGN